MYFIKFYFIQLNIILLKLYALTYYNQINKHNNIIADFEIKPIL